MRGPGRAGGGAGAARGALHGAAAARAAARPRGALRRGPGRPLLRVQRRGRGGLARPSPGSHQEEGQVLPPSQNHEEQEKKCPSGEERGRPAGGAARGAPGEGQEGLQVPPAVQREPRPRGLTAAAAADRPRLGLLSI